MGRDIPLSLVVSFVFYWLFVLYWRYELPCQDKLPEFHYTPILGCIRVLWLVFHPLGLGLDKALFVWNSVNTDPLGIKPPPYDFEIPLRTAGTIIYADTHAPTQSELASLPFIVLMSSADWDPHHVRFPSHDVEGANRATINVIQAKQQ